MKHLVRDISLYDLSPFRESRENSMALINFDDYLETLASDPGHQADILLLTCMDSRFFTKTPEKMKGTKSDQVIRAGRALGVVGGPKHCHDTFFDHLNLAINLHGVNRVIVMEHRECGAYGPPPGFGLLPKEPDRDEERRVHCEQ